MKTINQSIWKIGSIFFFCAGVSILLLTASRLFTDYKEIKNAVFDNRQFYRTEDDAPPVSNLVTKEELTGFLMAEPDYDFQIDGEEYESYSFNPRLFAYKKLSPIYEKNYIFDSAGNIMKICFQRPMQISKKGG